MENVYVMNHPLIQHKISMLRDSKTGTNEFRKLVEEIGILMGYEALRDLPMSNHQPFQHFVQLHFNDSFTIQLIIITDTATRQGI